ncbi:antitoxin [Microbacterium sp. GXF7504]
MGLEDLINNGKKLYDQNQDKIQAALKSEQAEQISDKLLDGASGVAKKVTGGKFDSQIDGARDAADKAVGTE